MSNSLLSNQTLKLSETKRLQDMTVFEKRLISSGIHKIVGVDEAGRGPLAGPVVACSMLFHEGLLIEGLNDSKKLSPQNRKNLYDQILSHKDTKYGIGIVSAQEIDQINILQATFLSMKIAIEALDDKIEYVLIDGNQLPKVPYQKEAIVKGDQRSISIAAASIVAKEIRDEIMQKFHEEYPEYCFNEHKGYGTKKHKDALMQYGPCAIHRMTFKPISEMAL